MCFCCIILTIYIYRTFSKFWFHWWFFIHLTIYIWQLFEIFDSIDDVSKNLTIYKTTFDSIDNFHIFDDLHLATFWFGWWFLHFWRFTFWQLFDPADDFPTFLTIYKTAFDPIDGLWIFDDSRSIFFDSIDVFCFFVFWQTTCALWRFTLFWQFTFWQFTLFLTICFDDLLFDNLQNIFWFDWCFWFDCCFLFFGGRHVHFDDLHYFLRFTFMVYVIFDNLRYFWRVAFWRLTIFLTTNNIFDDLQYFW